MTDDLLIWGEPYTHNAIVDTLSSQLKAFNAHWPLAHFFVSQHNKDEFKNSWVANLYPELQDFRSAHTAFFDQLFARPAAALGCSRWGLKGVLLTAEHAVYLRWLYPHAKFLFLYRNPFDAWRSYRRWRRWYRRWPDQPVHTPTEFGQLWYELTGDFLRRYDEVDGLLLRYEDLTAPQTRTRIENYLERPVTAADGLERIKGTPRKAKFNQGYLPKIEKMLLARQIEPLASALGYSA
jgi:hypothetical protein